MSDGSFTGDKINDPLDVYVGKKLREFRLKVNWTLSDLASRVEVSHQQIHKYEQAQSKISATMLFRLSEVFGTTPSSFFEGYEAPNQSDTNTTKDLIGKSKKDVINLLLVEDNPADEYLVRKALSSSSYNFNTYLLHNGEDVLRLLKDRKPHPFPKPDIILLDLHLPGMSGHDVLRAIKQDREIQEIPVLIMTGSLNKADLIMAYKNHTSGYISKAFDYENFETALHQTLKYWVEAVVLPTSN